jgi:2-C-methyl-D-erythritol 4-phosphate cytidylyltransferase/2-C-methyl-D-erythritol 2,4-cyclodiphosphate synthase
VTRFRIGQGFDAHRFLTGRELRLCGLSIPGEVGLAGHSDADVGLHAVTDAILGALARGDLGEHFPSSDPQWKGADSKVFLNQALDLAAGDGYRLVNCDLTLIGERPIVAPFRDRLRFSLADILGVDLNVVSVKATTSEGLGFTGRGEGLAALAVVLLEGRLEHE